MRRIGLTGNIASGKSAVAAAWRALGAEVIDADALARRAVEPGTQALARIAARFGPGVIGVDGLDRAALRAIVFADPAERAALEAIVHPEVARLRDAEEANATARGAHAVVHEIPLLFETGLAPLFDAIVLVDAPEPERLRRIVATRGVSGEEAKRMIAAQMPASAKRARADVIIENDGTLAELEARAADAWRQLVEHDA
jgi:dephospho-CoA kinase